MLEEYITTVLQRNEVNEEIDDNEIILYIIVEDVDEIEVVYI